MEVIDSAMAAGAYSSIPGHLLDEARRNPELDWNATIRHVLTMRSIAVGHRTYTTCLVGIPLLGRLGKAFTPIGTVHCILKEAQRANILSKEDGLIFLDSPIPRGTIQLMDFKALYDLSSRLFERGVRQNQISVLDAQLLESEANNVEAAVLVGLLYWRSEKAQPSLLSDHALQRKLADIVRQHVLVECASPENPMPFVHSQPLSTFFEATRESSRHIAKKNVERLYDESVNVPFGAEFNVLSSEQPIGAYQIEVTFLTHQGKSPYILRLSLDTLCDGNAGDYLDLLTAVLKKRGVSTFRTTFFSRVSSSLETDGDIPIYEPTSLH